MNRRFKYRIWEDYEMNYRPEVHPDYDNLPYPLNRYLKKEKDLMVWFKDWWDYIYEGDILKIRIDWYLQTDYYIVEDILEFWFERHRTEDEYRIHKFKVIWNTYENPELLNNK